MLKPGNYPKNLVQLFPFLTKHISKSLDARWRVEILEFFYYSDFMWNQFLEILELQNLPFSKLTKFRALNVAKITVLDLDF